MRQKRDRPPPGQRRPAKLAWFSRRQLTDAFSPAPALNFTCFEAGILICSPVRGLRPTEASLLTTWKVPKPTLRNSPCFFSAASMPSNTASTALPASAFESPAFAATTATNSFLFTIEPPFANRVGKDRIITPADARKCRSRLLAASIADQRLSPQPDRPLRAQIVTPARHPRACSRMARGRTKVSASRRLHAPPAARRQEL